MTFPHITRLGLSVRRVTYEHDDPNRGYQGRYTGDVVDAKLLEKLLEGAPVVYGDCGGRSEPAWTREQHEADDTHTALLVGVRPIERDSFEGLLRELMDKIDNGGGLTYCESQPYLERARKLLGGEK